MPTIAPPESAMTVEELAARVGAIPYWRIRTVPPPGEATEDDVERVRREDGALCELIDGVLVEKAVSSKTSIVGMELGRLLGNFVIPRKLGWIQGSDGFTWLAVIQLRAPDVAFVRRNQRAGGKLPDRGYDDVAPALVVEVFSPGNTAKEMERKRREFFAAGTELFWIVYPDRQEIEVFTEPETHRLLKQDDTLDGGTVLPGFSVKVGEIFAAVDLGDEGAN